MWIFLLAVCAGIIGIVWAIQSENQEDMARSELEGMRKELRDLRADDTRLIRELRRQAKQAVDQRIEERQRQARSTSDLS